MIFTPKGYIFSTAQANFRYSNRDDLALILSQREASCAAVFTKNLFKAAPIKICKRNLQKNKYQVSAIVINSGIANAGTGKKGEENCIKSLNIIGSHFNLPYIKILPASTGVIGEQFSMKCWENGSRKLKENLGKKNIIDVAKAIMTTDTFPKICSKKIKISNIGINILGIAKGAGMICPNMATMLAFILTDAKIEHQIWQKILEESVEKTFNRISVDGDTSTNDCVIALANGYHQIENTNERFLTKIKETILEICNDLSYKIIQDAEGGTKVIHLSIKKASSISEAKKIAYSIAHSPLVKTAFYGEDANWGRIVAAIGRSGTDIDIENLIIKINKIEIFKNGKGLGIDLDSLLLPHLKKQDIYLEIILGNKGSYEYNFLFSDLSEEYVRINGSYRT